MRFSESVAIHFRYKVGQEIVFRQSGLRGTVVDAVLDGDPNGAHKTLYEIRKDDGSIVKAMPSEIKRPA